jgi:serine protease Do
MVRARVSVRRGLHAVLLALLALTSHAHAERDPIALIEAREQQIFEQIGPSVVFISTYDGFGSGFFVGEGGLILTSNHVVGHYNTVKIVTQDGKTWSGKVIERASQNTDLALVKIELAGAAMPPVLELACGSELRVGSWVGSVGHGRGGVWAFNTGIVSNIYPVGHDRPVFQTQIPLNPGSSGGPIVDRHGRVVGIVTAGIVDSNNINFAIRSDVALKSFKTNVATNCLTIDAPANVSVFYDGSVAGTGPRVLVDAQPGPHEVFAVIGGAMKKRKLSFPELRHVTLE